MDAWENILKTALLGTGREPLGQAECMAGIAEAIDAACKGVQPPHALLHAAAIVGTARLAGVVPTAIPAEQFAAAPETTAECSAAAAACVARMLAGEYQDALPECLAALAAAGRRIPHALLADLLALAAQKRDLRPLLRAVMGQRGAWLMKQNPQWQFDTLDDDATAWETGTREMRLAAFRRMRASDAAAALQRLSAAWQQETPDDRAQLIESLAAGLSIADEPFLESALDDRRKEVRRAAAELLMRLPASRLVERMTQRLHALIRVTAMGKGKQTVAIDVTLPAACDKAMLRDGMELKPQPPMGEKAWWLQQIIAATPPSALTGSGAFAPAALMEAAGRSDWADAICHGWAAAAARHRDIQWAAAMLAWQLNKPVEKHDARLIATLAEVLPSPQRESAVLGALETYHLDLMSPTVRALLLACGTSWSNSLSRQVVQQLRQAFANDNSWIYYFREDAGKFALRMDVSVAPELGEVAGADKSQSGARAADLIVGMVQFRSDMLKEIRS